METLKCKVQDPGFPDTEVTCLKTDDGQTYFFIENGTLKNGNIISTPILKEGIGHAPYTSLGLITPQGEVLIPFENKNIKPLSNELLLVERNTPTTDSVVEALNKQNDPLSASELIETANTIKEQMKSIMGPTNTYVFDNQFSEAALYTTAGVNLANDYFSFIANDNGAYYMSKNVVGSSISKYDPYMAVDQNQEESVDTNQIENTEIAEQSQEVTTPEIPTVENSDDNISDVTLPNVEQPTTRNEDNIKPKEEDVSNEALLPNINIEPSSSIENNTEGGSEIEIPSVNSVNYEESNPDLATETEEESPKLNIAEEEAEPAIPMEMNLEADTELNSTEEQSVPSSENQENDIDSSMDEYDLSQETPQEDNEDSSSASEENYQSLDGSEENSDFTSMSESAENNNEESKEDDDAYFEEQIGNPIIANATNTIRKLLEENRNQRQVIDRQEGELDTLNSSNEILKEDNSSKTKEIITLRNSNAKYRSDNTDLTRENSRLKSTIQRQEELIEHLKSQNSALKEQVAGITTLSNVVAEANNLFSISQEADYGNNSSEFSYLDEDSDSYQYTKKAA